MRQKRRHIYQSEPPKFRVRGWEEVSVFDTCWCVLTDVRGLRYTVKSDVLLYSDYTPWKLDIDNEQPLMHMASGWAFDATRVFATKAQALTEARNLNKWLANSRQSLELLSKRRRGCRKSPPQE